jgi:hypothetical protein
MIVIVPALFQTCSLPLKVPEKGFVSWLPGSCWEEALLTGNGTIGAMAIGRPHDETIILNHALLYLPASDRLAPINQAGRLEEIRRLLLSGKYAEATKIPMQLGEADGYGGTRWTDPFMPALDIRIDMSGSNVKDYARAVNFTTGEASVVWRDENGSYRRDLFASRADSCVVIRIKGSGKINAAIELRMHPLEWSQRELVFGAIESVETAAQDKWLTYRSNFKRRYADSPEGYEAVGKVIQRGGRLHSEGNRIMVSGAVEVLVLMRLEPNFKRENSRIADLKADLDSRTTEYARLLGRHVKLHGELYKRVKLDLGGKKIRRLQSEALISQAQDKVIPAMVERIFDAARYNTICATGTRPPNLQGIWNGNWTPPWSSDFTQDGNLQVAVSGLLSGHLTELIQSYCDYQESMLPFYEDNARRLYGCRGIHVPSRTSSHGWDIHFGETWCLTFWTAGAGWAASFFYDYYLYTGDLSFLRTRAYPFMKAAALFYEDFLTIGDNGKYIFNPSYSPENNPANTPSQACINATMDVMVAKQLLRNCIAAAEALKTDKEAVIKWTEMLTRMPDYEVNPDGALREWLWPGLEDNYAHRHVSHLYGLYEMIDPDIAGDQRLMSAVRTSIEKRMEFRRREKGGEMVFGLAQMAFIAANLGDAALVEELIDWMAGRYWNNSLASLHNPGNLFNMDLSGGFPAAVMRALVYSEPGVVGLLPALPPSWSRGRVEGVLARGQIEIKSLDWRKNRLTVAMRSQIEQTVKLRLPRPVKTVQGKDRRLFNIDAGDQYHLTLPAGRVVKLAFRFE